MTDPLAPHPTLRRYYETDGERQRFVNRLFDRGSRHYDEIDRLLAFGSGPWYRGDVLRRAGLTRGMRVLDVATGTGPVATSAKSIVGEEGRVVGVDPSGGMLGIARHKVDAHFVQAVGEALALRGEQFDFVVMGYALRHVPDLGAAFHEYRRVLRAGGRVVLLELAMPRSRIQARLLRAWLGGFIPKYVRWRTGSADAEEMMKYYWDTIATCVPAETILESLRAAGFTEVHRDVKFGVLTEYHGVKR